MTDAIADHVSASKQTGAPFRRHGGWAPLIGALAVLLGWLVTPMVMPPAVATDEAAGQEADARQHAQAADAALAQAAHLAVTDVALQRALDASTRVTEPGFIAGPLGWMTASVRGPVRGGALDVVVPTRIDGDFGLTAPGRDAPSARLRLLGLQHTRAVLRRGLGVVSEAQRGVDLLLRSTADALQALYLVHDAQASHAFDWAIEPGADVGDVVSDGAGGLMLRDRERHALLQLPRGRAWDGTGASYPVVPRWDAQARLVRWTLEGTPAAYPVLVDPVVMVPLWEWVSADLVREDHAMAYDVVRDQVVMFGGTSSLDDTWLFDGGAWLQQRPAQAPAARREHAMVYDVARDEVVLFGGRTLAGQYFGDTWVWDGSNWAQRTPANSPSARAAHAMTYDAVRSEVVLFGGGDASSRSADTWVWDGSNWTQRAPTNSPSARHEHRMAFDAGTGTTLLFGGWNNAVAFSDTWVWDGTDWAQQSPAHVPVGRRKHAMAYDAARGQVVMNGGTAAAGQQTWVWDGSDWTDTMLATLPRPRYGHAMVYDSARQRMVVLGGGLTSGAPWGYRHTYFWNGSAWSSSGPASPPGSSTSALVHDPSTQQVLLIGGPDPGAAGGKQSGAWAWDGQRWTRAGFLPFARDGSAAAYDEARAQLVVFGGRASSWLGDTWLRTAGTWTQVTPGTEPSARYGHAMAYDAAHQQVVLFGGITGGSETWLWNGTTWSQATPTTVPPARYGHAMAYDEANDEVVMLGGNGTVDSDTWIWNGSDWSKRTLTLGPTRSSSLSPSLTFDRNLSRIVAAGFNGADQWSWDGSVWEPLTLQVAPGFHGVMTYDATRDELLELSSTLNTWVARSYARQLGSDCTSDGQCDTGHCVDAVCCYSACGGQCERCDEPTNLGWCTAVAYGDVPTADHTPCTDDGSLCGGYCNGTQRDGCVYPTVGTCQLASCVGGMATPAGTCDGAGSCQVGSSQGCSPYACNAFGTGCASSCGGAADCAAGHYCATGSCVPLRTQGQTCDDDTQCSSTLCVDGRCCDGACSGQCEACNRTGLEGQCGPISGAPVGTRSTCLGSGACAGTCDGVNASGCSYPDSNTVCAAGSCTAAVATPARTCDGAGGCPAAIPIPCSPYTCDSSNLACDGDCSGSTDCGAGYYCNAGVCSTKLSQGATCSSSGSCGTGHCVDGRCCDTLCNGQCEACDVAGQLGTCTAVPAGGLPRGGRAPCVGAGAACGGTCDGSTRDACDYPQGSTTCHAATCSGVTASAAVGCDGAGRCPAATPASCGAYLCDAAGLACRSSCSDDGACAAGRVCSAGACIQPLADGQACTDENACDSGHCVSGLCCDQACDGTAQRCDDAATPGTCVGVQSDAGTVALDAGEPSVDAGVDGGLPVSVPDAGPDSATRDAGDTRAAGGTGGQAGTGGDGASGAAGTGGESDDDASGPSGGGCNCRTSGSAGSADLLSVLLVGLALLRRRRPGLAPTPPPW